MPANTPATIPMMISKTTATARQLDRHGQRPRDGVQDRPPVEVGTEVAVQQIAEILQVLDAERVVQVELIAQLGHHGGGQRAVTGQGANGVARQRVDHGEDQERRAEQDRDRQQEAARDVAAHVPPQVCAGPRSAVSHGSSCPR
jgi:hypothetical protein